MAKPKIKIKIREQWDRKTQSVLRDNLAEGGKGGGWVGGSLRDKHT